MTSSRRIPSDAATARQGRDKWLDDYDRSNSGAGKTVNRSGIEINPLYTPEDLNPGHFDEDLGYPGQEPFTRGIYASMHRGRPWSQRQLIGIATPDQFNRRQKELLSTGSTAVNLIPCNSVFRGYDMDEVEPEILGTRGTLINTTDDVARCRSPWRRFCSPTPASPGSTGANCPAPRTKATICRTISPIICLCA